MHSQVPEPTIPPLDTLATEMVNFFNNEGLRGFEILRKLTENEAVFNRTTSGEFQRRVTSYRNAYWFSREVQDQVHALIKVFKRLHLSRVS